MFRAFSFALLGLAAAMMWTSIGNAQEDPAEQEFRGRVPAYFADVVREDQKAAIYAVQKKYKDQEAEISARLEEASELIKQLREQLEGLQALRNAEIEALLSPEQLLEVRKKMEANLLKRLEELKAKTLKVNEKPAPVGAAN